MEYDALITRKLREAYDASKGGIRGNRVIGEKEAIIAQADAAIKEISSRLTHKYGL